MPVPDPIIPEPKTSILQRRNIAPDILFVLALLIVFAAATAIYMKTTEKGLGLVSDSVNYLNGASSIARGDGYFRASGGGTIKPITNFPPLYSIVLALPILSGVEPLRAARGVGIVFWLLNLGLVLAIVSKTTRNRWIGILAAALYMVSKPFLYYQVFAMSESVFFFCTLAVIWLYLRAVEKDTALLWVLCGVACGAAFLARYVGAVSLAAVIFCLLFLKSEKARTFRAIGLTLAGALPLMAAWLLRNRIVSGNISNRSAGIHPLTMNDFYHGALIWVRWLFPGRYNTVEQATSWMAALAGLTLAACLLILLLAMINRFRINRPLSAASRLVVSAAAYIPAYIFVVWVTISFLDASVNIEERILYPCLMIFLLMLIALFGMLRSRLKDHALVTAAGVILMLAFTLVSASETRHFIPKFSTDGYGWAWAGWQDSPAMNILKKLPPQKVIYSNQPEAVSLFAGRGAYALLDPIDPSSDLPREGYWETLEAIRNEVLAGKSVLAFFSMEAWLPQGETNWISTLTDGLPAIYRDTSEWVLGIEENE